MSNSVINSNQTSKLNRYGQRGILINFFFIIFSLPMLLVSAGTINWINGWIYFGLILGYGMAYTLILMRIDLGFSMNVVSLLRKVQNYLTRFMLLFIFL